MLKTKSFEFALLIIEYLKQLKREKEYIFSNQLLRSGTAVGALIREAEFAESRRDFIHKLSVALKESSEVDYWLDLIHYATQENTNQPKILKAKNMELMKMLVSSINTAKARIGNTQQAS